MQNISSAVPYYLQPNSTVKEQTFGQFDLYDFNLPSNDYVGDSRSLWGEIGDNLDQAGDYVFNSIDGVWESVKDVGSSITDAAGNYIEYIKSNLLWVLGVGLVVIYFVAKSGIIKQIGSVI